jgi:formylglycine-generating enzyme required for sulfatase activity
MVGALALLCVLSVGNAPGANGAPGALRTIGAAHTLSAPRAPRTIGGALAAEPPGLVLVPGGRTQIGIEPRELVRLLEAEPNAQNYAGSISAETPRHERTVERFFLMTTEVTNEQYFTFVNATGVRPPEHWGEAAMRDGLTAFYKEEEALKQAALAAGRPAPSAATFDRRLWWRDHWQSSKWSMPEGDEKKPVVFVDFTDARAYARWAGLRLPTEFEHQRAVRGDTTRAYPWGNDWDNEKYAATSHLRKKGTLFPVASFPGGVSRQGVFDLAGNVWEWTSSPYTPFPGYERRVFEFGYGDKKRTVNALADFDEVQRVVVGGSFQTSQIMARASTRRAAEPDQATDALGFRCAASPHAGFDAATFVLESDLTPNIRPRDEQGMIAYAPESCVAVDHWTSRTGADGPPGYAVIEGYRFALFTPVRTLPASDPQTLEKRSLEDNPVPLGFLSTSERVREPDLAPGTYLVSFRARGMRPYASARAHANGDRDTKPASEPPIEETLGLDITFDHLIFTSLTGRAVCAMPTKLEWANLRESRVEIAPPTDTDPSTTLRFALCLDARGTQKGCLVDLPLRFERGTIDASWMR